jgi:hypothetical protein
MLTIGSDAERISKRKAIEPGDRSDNLASHVHTFRSSRLTKG